MGVLKRGKQGESMQGLEVSPERRKRTAKRRKKQEERWARKSGPVQTRRASNLSNEEKARLGLDDSPNSDAIA